MRTISSLVLVALLTGGCDSGEDTLVIERHAALVGQPGFESVSGVAVVTSEAGQTSASVTIGGATPGAAHPWHVHEGSCATSGPIVGDMFAYPDLAIASDGTASASATVDVGLSPTGSYFVNVHLSADDLQTIVACGDLTNGGGNPAPPGNGDY